MNLNDQEFEIDTVRNYRIYGIPQKDFFFFYELFIQLISNKSYLVQTDK